MAIVFEGGDGIKHPEIFGIINALTWGDVIFGRQYSSAQTKYHLSPSNKYRIASSNFGYYLITEEHYQAEKGTIYYISKSVYDTGAFYNVVNNWAASIKAPETIGSNNLTLSCSLPPINVAYAVWQIGLSVTFGSLNGYWCNDLALDNKNRYVAHAVCAYGNNVTDDGRIMSYYADNRPTYSGKLGGIAIRTYNL